MTTRRIVLPYPPSANNYWRTTKGGRTYVSEEAREFKAAVARLCFGTVPTLNEVALAITVYRPRRIGDLSNTLKVLEDALQGFCYRNDDQVVEIRLTRCDDKHNPRAEVLITELPTMPRAKRKASRSPARVVNGLTLTPAVYR